MSEGLTREKREKLIEDVCIALTMQRVNGLAVSNPHVMEIVEAYKKAEHLLAGPLEPVIGGGQPLRMRKQS